MKKRICASLLAAILLLSATSCGGGADNPSIAKENSSDSTGEVTTQTIISRLPDADFGGYEFNIFGEKLRDYYFVEEQTGEVVNDAIFERNQLVSERYNIKLNFNLVDWMTGNKQIEQNVLAGDNSYDLLTSTHLYLGNCLINGYFLDWSGIPHVDLSQDYYVKDANETYSIGDKTMLLFGDFMESTYRNCWIFLFNKELAEQNKITDLYATVDSGKWTIDYLTEIIKDTAQDLDGNTVYDKNDFYGLTLDRYGSVDSFVRALGLSAISKDENNYPVLDFYNEQTVDAYNKLYSLFHGADGVYSKGEAFTTVNDFFVQDRCIFTSCLLEKLMDASIRDMKTDYGVLPFPKGSESQEKYLTYLDGTFSAQMIAITAPEENLERTGIIVEALNAYSHEYILPAVYDTSLKLKFTRDDDSSRMLDIILDGRSYSFDSFDENGFLLSPRKALRDGIQQDRESISSYYDSVKVSCEEWIKNIIETYESANN